MPPQHHDVDLYCNAPAYFRTFGIFFGGGFLVTVAVLSLWFIGDVVWIDFLHENPHRTRGHALLLAALSPLYGIFGAILLKLPPLLTGAVWAVLGRAIFGSLPLLYVIVVLPVCVLADQAQFWWLFPGAIEEEIHPLEVRVLKALSYQLPVLLVCWWWDRRRGSA